MLSRMHTDRLKDIKTKIQNSHQYFQPNIDRFHKFYKFVFSTSLSQDDISKLQKMKKPQLEFNVLESIISRLRGEFSRQEPGILVRADDNVPIQDLTPEYIEMMGVVEGHLREILLNKSNDNLQYKLYTDTLGGGWAVVHIHVQYVNEMSFNKKIVVDHVDPTMCGFDPLAKKSHKGDGQYCYMLSPLSKDEFISEFGAEAANSITFSRVSSSFSWSYSTDQADIVLIADYYEKKKKKIKIVKISSGHILTMAHYKELLERWEMKGFIEQAPIIIEERTTEITTIVRYRLCESMILDYTETDFNHLPLIFYDGNSVNIKDGGGVMRQMTRPYAYHAEGIQRLRNFSGQTIAQEIENMVMQKWVASIESIPDEYLEAYRNPQSAQTLLFNQFLDGNINVPLMPPREIQRTPTPPIVENTFLGSDSVTQSILGAYDSTPVTNQTQMSGEAYIQGQMQSNLAATPYLTGYICGANRTCEVVVDLLPKYYNTPRSLPVMTSDGKRTYKFVNYKDNQQSVNLEYNPNDLGVEVEAGVNTSVQKQYALDQIIRLMQASPTFAVFINTMGLGVLLDNIDIRNIEHLKMLAAKFMEMQEQAKAQAAEQPDPMQEMIKAQLDVEHAKIEQKAEEAEGDLTIQAAKLALEKQKIDLQIMQVMSEIKQQGIKLNLEHEKVDSENARTAIETAMELTKAHHEMSQEKLEKKETKDNG